MQNSRSYPFTQVPCTWHSGSGRYNRSSATTDFHVQIRLSRLRLPGNSRRVPGERMIYREPDGLHLLSTEMKLIQVKRSETNKLWNLKSDWISFNCTDTYTHAMHIHVFTHSNFDIDSWLSCQLPRAITRARVEWGSIFRPKRRVIHVLLVVFPTYRCYAMLYCGISLYPKTSDIGYPGYQRMWLGTISWGLGTVRYGQGELRPFGCWDELICQWCVYT